jgi:hypothetical protein
MEKGAQGRDISTSSQCEWREVPPRTSVLTTNGGPARGIYSVDPRYGTAIPIVNNFRGRHLNSPNDLVFNSNSNI